VFIELSGHQAGFLSAFGSIFAPEDSHRLNALAKEFAVGDVVFVKVLRQMEQTASGFRNFELKLASTCDYEVAQGRLVTARVLKANRHDLRVQIQKDVFGSIDICEISDAFLAEPLASLSVFKYVACRVLETAELLSLSARESMVDEATYRRLTQSTVSYKKHFQQVEAQFDLRPRLIRFGIASINNDQLMLGYVVQMNASGVFVKVGFNTTVRAPVQKDLREHQLVLCRVVKIREDKKVDVSLDPAVVLHGKLQLELDHAY